MGKTGYQTKCRKCGKVHDNSIKTITETREMEFINIVEFVTAFANKAMLLPCDCIKTGSTVHDVVAMTIDTSED